MDYFFDWTNWTTGSLLLDIVLVPLAAILLLMVAGLILNILFGLLWCIVLLIQWFNELWSAATGLIWRKCITLPIQWFNEWRG